MCCIDNDWSHSIATVVYRWRHNLSTLDHHHRNILIHLKAKSTMETGVTHQPALWFEQGSVNAIHLVVEAARVTQVVASAVTAP